jgi:hypothetical protein
VVAESQETWKQPRQTSVKGLSQRFEPVLRKVTQLLKEYEFAVHDPHFSRKRLSQVIFVPP